MKKLLPPLFLLSLVFLLGCSSTKPASSGNIDRDGSSFEKAIIVNNISEEYAYAKKVCSDCSFIQQALVFEKRKPYDILTFKKPGGQTVEYYFDISSFYGKW